MLMYAFLTSRFFPESRYRISLDFLAVFDCILAEVHCNSLAILLYYHQAYQVGCKGRIADLVTFKRMNFIEDTSAFKDSCVSWRTVAVAYNNSTPHRSSCSTILGRYFRQTIQWGLMILMMSSVNWYMNRIYWLYTQLLGAAHAFWRSNIYIQSSYHRWKMAGEVTPI